MSVEHFDVLIVGAGLSGIGAAYHLQTNCPRKSYAILESRDQIGGTWDLFRYPGVRSDSDMYTLGYAFKPWNDPSAIADGSSILAYVRETARENGIDKKIRFRQRVESARWSSSQARWSITASDPTTGARTEFTCGFLFMCSGYYDYEEGYTPDFPGRDRFLGRIVHPQNWTSEVEYEGKRVVVIGSGATAVTLVPELAQKAVHVTMLQRSPTYLMSIPTRDGIANRLRSMLPTETAYAATRWKNVLLGSAWYSFCRRFPDQARKVLVGSVRKAVPEDVDIERHFNPTYNPWDQRLCLVTDGDLFKVIQQGRASVITDHIDSFTERGIKLRSGQELEADLIVTATGLKLKLLGGMKIEVDGRPIKLSEMLTYKGVMASDVPNLAFAIGYTNASWTLKIDLTCEYVCRLLNYMDEHGYRRVVPRRSDSVNELPLIDFSSGYVTRSLAELPRQGHVTPWRLYQNYILDRFILRRGKLVDSALELSA